MSAGTDLETSPVQRPWEWAVPLVKLLAWLVLALGFIVGILAWEAADFDGEAFVGFLLPAFQGLLGFGTLAILALIAETLLEGRDIAKAQRAELSALREQQRPATRRRST